MTGLADVDGFKIYIQVCVWLGSQPLNSLDVNYCVNYSLNFG